MKGGYFSCGNYGLASSSCHTMTFCVVWTVLAMDRETGQSRTPPYKYVFRLVKERRALAVTFCEHASKNTKP